MKKMVFFSPTKPDVVNGGGLYKSKRLIEYFSGTFDFQGVYLNHSSASSSSGSGNDLIIGLNAKRHKISFKNLLLSYLNSLPLSVYRNSVKADKAKLAVIYDACKSADVIFVDHFFMFQYVPPNFYHKVVFHEHNAEFKIWQRRSLLENNPLKRMALKIESERVKNYEVKAIKKSKITFAAPDDITHLAELASNDDCFYETLHLGQDDLLNTSLNNFSLLGNSLVFLGNMNWDPNLNGIRWFLKTCWKTLRLEYSDVKLDITGEVSSAIRSELEQYDGVTCLGYVEDLDTALSNAKVFICPLQYGSGMKVKNITAMYKGLPIVSTSIGTESITFSNKNNVLVADTPDEFMNAVRSLLNSDSLCVNLGTAARALAKERYSWGAMLDKMYDDIQNTFRGC